MYKPVLPSSLIKLRGEGELDFSDKIFGNNALKLGVVIEILDVDNDANVTKIGPEYNVMSLEQDKQNGMNTSIYKNCISFNSFGGVADFFEVKLREPADAAKVKNSGSIKDQTGSIVLLLCLDGNSEKAVIIGCIDNPNRKTTLTKEAGHHMEGEFNGVNYQVNKDGELTVTFKSATDNEGIPQDEEAGGTFVKVDKTGSIDINDGNTENIKIDKVAKTIDSNAESDISNTTKANFNVTADESFNVTAKMDMIMKASGKANWEVKGVIDIKSDADINVKAKNTVHTYDNQMFLKCPTYLMQAENAILNNTLTTIGPGPLPATYLPTFYLGVGNLGAPVISFAIGPFSSSVFISG